MGVTVLNNVSQESVKLLTELKQHGVRFAHWKGNSHLLESLEGKSDLEILVLPEDRTLYELVLDKLGYKRLKSQAWNSYPQVEDWIGFDPETGNLLHLHTHYALILASSYANYIHLPWIKEFFQNLQIDEQTEWPVPKPELEALILLIRIWAKIKAKPYKEEEILRSKKTELYELLRKTDIEALNRTCSKLKITTPADIDEKVYNILETGSSEEIKSLAAYFYGQLPDHLKPSAFTALKSFYYRYYLKSSSVYAKLGIPFKLKKTIVNGGKVIALVGSDGSGKSTLSKDLTDWLTYKIDTHYFYLGKRPFIKSYNRRLSSKSDILSGNNILSKLLKKVTGKAYYVLMIKQKADMLQLAKKMSKLGSVIICDRFPQQNINGINDGPKLQKSQGSWPAKMEKKLFNKAVNTNADVVIRLLVSPEVAYNRKPEHSFDVIKAKCENIHKLSFPKAVVVDMSADRPYNEVLLSVKQEIWKCL